ncbi:acyltransferase family protein [Arenibacterium sp. CAU 1754]
MHPKQGETYRPELDGVRALAILFVLGFHVGFSDWSGGFLGVDVFFVLSGWLICGHIHDNLRMGRFDVLDFFARRIRRLIPAAFTCYLVVTLVVFLLFLPHERQDFLRYLLGSSFFINNFILMGEAGYFAPTAGANPLLHTWSLSIEEQFYLLVPWLALLMGRNAKAFAVLLAVAFVVSLGLTLFSGKTIHNADARYFSSLFRIWEIAAGGLAYVVTRGRDLPRLPGVAPAALFAVLVPVFVFDETLLHPGPGALLVVAGTLGLILFARPERSLVGRLLGARPMAFIGRISYSTYLWHWPLIVFLEYVGYDLSDTTRVLVIIGSLLLGYLSLRVIEAPFRRMEIPTRNRALFSGYAVQTMVIVGLAGLMSVLSVGRDDEASSQIAVILAEGRIGNDRWDDCWYDQDAGGSCALGRADGLGRPMLLWGDSMANSAVAAFDKLALDRHVGGLAFVTPACAPLAGLAHENTNVTRCLAANDSVLARLTEQQASDVFLFARWPMYFLGYHHTDLTTLGERDLIGRDLKPLDGDPRDLAEARLRDLIASIPKRHRVFIVGPVPEHLESVPDSMVRAIRFHDEVGKLTREVYEQRTMEVRNRLLALAAELNAVYIDPTEAFCGSETCPHEIDGVPIFADAVHLAPLGNQLLFDALKEGLR